MTTADELAISRLLLGALQTNMTTRRAGVDVTQQEIGILKREIIHLEAILNRGRA